MTTDYKLIRIWGMNLGSSPEYITLEVERARKAGAPQTAMYWQTAEQAKGHLDDRRAFWIEPKSNRVWWLFDEYLPKETRTNLNHAAARRFGQSLTDVLAEIGYVDRDRTYADVHATIDIEINVDAWMTEYDADRELALEQIRNDVATAIRVAFLHDKWHCLIEGAPKLRLSIEA